ncbi:polymer-forming cytoskeletal protein [Enterobacter sp. JMULE2]|uniref:bactofilin family protein n=1 Tax=Enterobacter sp. JMULE2 TaxID=2518340 RepID=UPI001575DA85|nr:polymer-forming cytoskeletal protein [Enterobacter sp. JMULE2]
MFNLKSKSKKNEVVANQDKSEKKTTPIHVKDILLTAVRKDVFIANGANLTGIIETEGSIVSEGVIEGNIRSAHEVRINNGGVVKGDIHAMHVFINGLVTGRCYASAVSLLEKGRIEGNIYTNELSIEKGGVFIGESSPSEYTHSKNDTFAEQEDSLVKKKIKDK